MQKCSDKNEDATNAILAFDTLYTTNHMKILKLLLPYLETEQQKKLAVYIKWQELTFTLQFFRRYSASLYNHEEQEKKQFNFQKLLPLLIPYCNATEKNLLSQFSQIQNMMSMMDNFQEYMPLIQQFMSSMSNEQEANENNNNIMEMLKSMMSEEQQAMFSMFMNSTE